MTSHEIAKKLLEMPNVNVYTDFYKKDIVLDLCFVENPSEMWDRSYPESPSILILTEYPGGYFYKEGA